MTALAEAPSRCPFSAQTFDPFDMTDPFPFYDWARAEAPVFFHEGLKHFIVTRYDDVKAVFSDWKTFSSENAQQPLRPMCAEGKKIMADGGFTAYSGLSARIPPDHTRIRKLTQTCFGPRRFKAIEPQIREIVNRAIDAFANHGQVDFFREFAYDVPALVLFKLVGVPDSDVPKVKSWAVSRALLTWGNLTDEEQIPHARNMVEYWKYCQALVAARHYRAADDLPGDLVRLQGEGEEITDDEIAGVLYSVLFAGHETTTSLLANGLRSFLKQRENWDAIIADPSKIPNAVEECLRFSPSIVSWRRHALIDTEIGGVKIPKGSNIFLVMGSANRDAAMFENGNSFDISRPDARKNLSLGYGIHACVGQQLAKLETAISLELLSKRLPSMRLAPDHKEEYARNTSFRVPTAVPIVWEV